ncbi:DUF4209 domain-containing protein [Massilia sp. Root335]|uniref:DUF4209 domain-containing protein n=1 Tax=Massilia sp. Root335 TaxID=1736517 RepID=UPI0006FFE058|nr:DUF4209 domain-containing protein [Massilia sp. Root335]KQV45117.1 hypothetical protein ASC93_00750 [Massilia sp. Root335]
MILVPAAVALRLSELEAAAPSWLDEHPWSAELEALAPDVATLNEAERRGCIAEIVAHRFMPTTSADRGPWDAYFGPVSSGTDANGRDVHVPDARQIDAEVVEYWKTRAELTPHPMLRARYADLAWEIGRIWNREHSDQAPIALPRELAQRTAFAYLDSAQMADASVPLQLFKAWRFLERALGLAISVKDATLIERAKKAAFDFNRANRAAGHMDQWWLIDDLVFDRKGLTLTEVERSEIAGWLTEALNTCSDLTDRQRFEPHLALQAADRIARWAAKSKQPELGMAALKQAAGAFEAFAKQANAMTATAWLEDLSIRYRQSNLPEDASRVDAEIIARSEEARQSMRLTSVPISVTNEDMECWLDELMADSPKQAIGRIAFHLMSDPDELHRQVESNAANAPLHASISITITDDNGFTTATIGSVKDDIPGRVLNAAATYIGGSSPWLHQALARLKTRWSTDAEALLAFLAQSPLFPPSTHGLLRAGIQAWFAGDFIKAVHVLVPQVEAGLREMLRAYGESPMRHNAHEGGFETIGMGTLLMNRTFKAHAHPWFRLHMRALYTSPKGLNLRNRVAHGLASADAFGLGMANWVIHSLFAIRTFGHLEPDTDDTICPDASEPPAAPSARE